MTDTDRLIFTIGHSNQAISDFLALLRANLVTAVADVRSAPYSRLYPEFNRESIRRALGAEGLAYVFLGRELGGRSQDPSCYVDGRVQYRKLAAADEFQRGLRRVMDGAGQYRIALLCAEKDPLLCHRSLLVSRELECLGATVLHIHSDGHLESQEAAMDRLLSMFGLAQPDMFRSRLDAIDDACARQEQRIAYVDEELRLIDERDAIG